MPRLYRSGENAEFEREMVRDFRLRGSAYMDRVPIDRVTWLFVMQHYGLPTRLLDWTESYLVALFFAVQNDDQAADAAAWILEPWSLNEVSDLNIGQTVPTSNVSIFDEYYTRDVDSLDIKRKVTGAFPLAVRPSRSTPRIVAQRGMFTIHGCEKVSLHNYAQKHGKSIQLEKIAIEGKARSSLKKELHLAGVSSSSLFPDLEGLSKEIHYRYSKAFVW